jgi:3-oxoacyl-[acyl-carrier protein] reductase
MGDCADLKDRCAIVTGGASGMGMVHAATFLGQGALVAITDNRQSALDEARERLGSTDRLLTVLSDNRDTAQIRRAVAAVEADFGRIDILVNNAGISGKRMPLEDIDEAAFDEMFAIHVRGAFFYIKAVIGGMKRRRDGRLINISSHFAMIGSAGASHYTSAKTALHGLTRACALELAPWGITANTVCPALIDTPLTRRSLGQAEIERQAALFPLGRIAEAQDVADAVAWLAGPRATMVTGQVIAPNGGIAIVGI